MKGLLCFDGDTIVGVNDSGKVEDALTDELNQSIYDQDVWKNCVLHIFRTIVKFSHKAEHPWCIFSTSNKFLVDSFKTALRFPLTDKEKKDRETDQQNREKERECLNCKKFYYEKDNGLESCSYHPDHLFNLKGDSAIRLTNDELIQIARKEKNSELFKDYAWYCCMKAYDSDGCKKYRHSDVESKKNALSARDKRTFDLEQDFYSILSPKLKNYLFNSFEQKCLFKFYKYDEENNYFIKSISNECYLFADISMKIAELKDYSSKNKNQHLFNIQFLEGDLYTIKNSNHYLTMTRENNNKLSLTLNGENVQFIIKKEQIQVILFSHQVNKKKNFPICSDKLSVVCLCKSGKRYLRNIYRIDDKNCIFRFFSFNIRIKVPMH